MINLFNNFLSSALVNPLFQPLPNAQPQSHHAGFEADAATRELGLINSTLAALPRHHGNPAHHQTYWELCDRAYELNRLLNGLNKQERE